MQRPAHALPLPRSRFTRGTALSVPRPLAHSVRPCPCSTRAAPFPPIRRQPHSKPTVGFQSQGLATNVYRAKSATVATRAQASRRGSAGDGRSHILLLSTQRVISNGGTPDERVIDRDQDRRSTRHRIAWQRTAITIRTSTGPQAVTSQ